MESTEHFALLREALAEPGEKSWRQLVRLFLQWQPLEECLLALDYALPHLENWETRVRYWSPRFPGGGIRAFLEHPVHQILLRLTCCLYMRHHRMRDEGFEHLLAHEVFEHLQILYLDYNGLSDQSMELLAQYPHMQRLEVLHLYTNQIGDRGIELLAKSPYLPSLRHLHIASNSIGDEGIRALLQSETLRSLETIECTRIDSESMREWGQMDIAIPLKRLIVHDIHKDVLGGISDAFEGIELLSAS